MTAQRSRLEGCVATIAERLADPDRVAETTNRSNPWIDITPDLRRPLWDPATLSGGLGVALLFAELAHDDPAYRRLAHRYLTRAAAQAAGLPAGGMHAGLVSIAFVAQATARNARDYATLLGKLDRRIADRVHSVVDGEQERIRAGGAGTSFDAYDAMTGLAGTGRYLLCRADELKDPLHGVLSYLTALTAPVPAGGIELPGWWVAHSPAIQTSADGGHVNFGMAHGIAGPLALLSLAWRDGHRVPGQDEAIGRIVGWLLDERGRRSAEPFWPPSLSPAEYADGEPPGRRISVPSWCYGAPGITRAIQLAGLALGEPAWLRAAGTVTRDIVTWLDRGLVVTEDMLCHGWAGLLQSLSRINTELDDPVVTTAVDDLAARVYAGFDPELPFGHRVHQMAGSHDLDLPGMLEGAAGIALAITAHLGSRGARSGWDASLLLA